MTAPANLESLLGFAVTEPAWSPCPKCEQLTASAPNEPCWDCRAKARAAREREERMRQLDRSVPDGFAWARFGARELEQRVERPDLIPLATVLANKGHARVVLRGRAGAGKTSLAIAMVRMWLERRDALAYFVPAMRLSGAAKFEVDSDMLDAPLVVLDDVGAERNLASNQLPELVYERHARDRATWITTHMTRDALADRYGEGIVRRLYERAIVLDFDPAARS